MTVNLANLTKIPKQLKTAGFKSMALDKSFDNVVAQKKENKREITKLTVLDKNDKNTIYHLIFAEDKEEIEET